MKEQDLAGGEGEIEVGTLRHHADEALGGDLFLPDVVGADPGLAGGGADARGEDAHRGGLAGAVGAQQAEDFASADFERDAVQGDDFGLRPGAAAKKPRPAACAATGGGEW